MKPYYTIPAVCGLIGTLASIQAAQIDVFNDAALGQTRWPPKVQQISNAFHNQLEIPVVFYVLIALALITQQTDTIFVVLSWLFVLSRLAHAFIHVTSNNVRYRGPAYLVGVAVLMAMWISFALSILIA